jgi:hypothetical protein
VRCAVKNLSPHFLSLSLHLEKRVRHGPHHLTSKKINFEENQLQTELTLLGYKILKHKYFKGTNSFEVEGLKKKKKTSEQKNKKKKTRKIL